MPADSEADALRAAYLPLSEMWVVSRYDEVTHAGRSEYFAFSGEKPIRHVALTIKGTAEGISPVWVSGLGIRKVSGWFGSTLYCVVSRGPSLYLLSPTLTIDLLDPSLRISIKTVFPIRRVTLKNGSGQVMKLTYVHPFWNFLLLDNRVVDDVDFFSYIASRSKEDLQRLKQLWSKPAH